MSVRIECDPKTVVAFDLDDTLYKEIDFLESGFAAVSHLYGSSRASEVERRLNALRSQGCPDQFGTVASEFANAVPVAEMLNMYRLHEPTISLEPGARDLLHAIRAAGAHVALITDGRSRTQRNKIKALGLAGLLDLVVVSEEVGSEKPAEENYLIVERSFQQAHRLYFIADNPRKDFVTPKRLGWGTIQLRDDGRNIHNQGSARDERFRAVNEVRSLTDIDVA